jgi:competence protein ComFC
MHCLWCHSTFIESISWQYVFGRSTPMTLCEQCIPRLEIIKGDICQKCGRPFTDLDPKYRVGNLCTDCHSWGEAALIKNRSIYVYNDFLQEVIARWKFRGDAELVKLFWPSLQKLLSEYEKIDVVVPIPLSSQRLYERSFNQAKALAEGLPFPIIEALVKPEDTEKQSKKTRKQRLEKKSEFQLAPDLQTKIQGKTILLVDDIYTTGATLYAAAGVLKAIGGAEKVFAVTVARG